MKIIRETVGDVLVVNPEGRLDANSSETFEKLVVEAMDDGVERILFDLSALVYISSCGLRVILLTAQRLQKGPGRMALCHLSEHVSEVFKLAGLTRILDIESSRELALDRFF